MKAGCFFLLLNLLIIGLYNSSDYSWFEIFSFVIPLSGADLSAWKGEITLKSRIIEGVGIIGGGGG